MIGRAFGTALTVGASVIALEQMQDLFKKNKPREFKPIKIKPFEGFRI